MGLHNYTTQGPAALEKLRVTVEVSFTLKASLHDLSEVQSIGLNNLSDNSTYATASEHFNLI